MNDEYFVNHLRPEFYYTNISQNDNDILLNYPFFLIILFQIHKFWDLIKVNWTLNTLAALDSIWAKYSKFEKRRTISEEYRQQFEILLDSPLFNYSFESEEPFDRPRSEPLPRKNEETLYSRSVGKT